MAMLAIHAAALSSNISSYHEFLARYSKTAKVVYGFVEGKDDPCFYRGFVELLIPTSWRVELWPAGNKDRVYAIHNDIDWRRFPKSRVCFFVDRDLSDLIPEALPQDNNIYVTSGYSIENDVVDKTTCHRTLTELCGFANANHGDLEAVCELFERELESFLQSMVPIMAWILLWRRAGMRPNLNNIQLRDIFALENGRLRSKPTPKGKANVTVYLHEKCNVVYTPGGEIASMLAEFSRKKIYRNFTRGKYVLWFLVEFCNAAHRDATALFNGMSKPPKMQVNLSCFNGIAVIGARARIPASLRTFIQSTFCTYIEMKEANGA